MHRGRREPPQLQRVPGNVPGDCRPLGQAMPGEPYAMRMTALDIIL